MHIVDSASFNVRYDELSGLLMLSYCSLWHLSAVLSSQRMAHCHDVSRKLDHHQCPKAIIWVLKFLPSLLRSVIGCTELHMWSHLHGVCSMTICHDICKTNSVNVKRAASTTELCLLLILNRSLSILINLNPSCHGIKKLCKGRH